MVHLPHAALADPAMVSPRRPIRLAPGADRPIVSLVRLHRGFRIAGVHVGEVHATLGKRNDAGVATDRFQVRHHQQQDDRVERHHVKRTPEAVLQAVQNNPANDDVIGVKYGNICHDNAHDAAGVFDKHFYLFHVPCRRAYHQSPIIVTIFRDFVRHRVELTRF